MRGFGMRLMGLGCRRLVVRRFLSDARDGLVRAQVGFGDDLAMLPILTLCALALGVRRRRRLSHRRLSFGDYIGALMCGSAAAAWSRSSSRVLWIRRPGDALVVLRRAKLRFVLTGAAVASAAPLASIFVAFVLAMGARFFLDQRQPIGDRDLVVIGMDFGKGQEAVAIAAIVYEGGL